MASTASRWGDGYSAMASHVLPAARDLLERLGSTPAGASLVDVGAGSCDAVAEARALGWAAVGVDLSAEQLRHCPPGLAARADAHRLPLPSGRFDGAISNFALIFAQRPDVVVAEVRRCLAPGGRFAFSAWCPDGWPGECRAILADALGRANPGFPTELGEVARAEALLDGAGFGRVESERRSLRWVFADVDEAVDVLTRAAGGLRVLRAELEAADRWDEVRPRLWNELAQRSIAVDRGVAIDDGYLAVSATR